ncbi:MAG: hypothetical protein IJ242_16785 [Clostridia bacterium]|nr:hypothetical protein [Clostridia bacterium]
MDSRIEIGWLFDFYGPLLSARQSELLTMWCEEDMSLSEIAEATGVSRQSVSSVLHMAQDHLKNYEEKLGLLARHRRLTNGLEQCLKLLETDPVQARDLIKQLLSEEE